jgi:hypothetical protein
VIRLVYTADIDARPEEHGTLRTVGYILASTVSYYVATQIAWSLTFPDSKVSLFFPPHAVPAVRAAGGPDATLVGVRARCRQRAFSRHTASGLADDVRLDLRSV